MDRMSLRTTAHWSGQSIGLDRPILLKPPFYDPIMNVQFLHVLELCMCVCFNLSSQVHTPQGRHNYVANNLASILLNSPNPPWKGSGRTALITPRRAPRRDNWYSRESRPPRDTRPSIIVPSSKQVLSCQPRDLIKSCKSLSGNFVATGDILRRRGVTFALSH